MKIRTRRPGKRTRPELVIAPEDRRMFAAAVALSAELKRLDYAETLATGQGFRVRPVGGPVVGERFKS